MINLLDLAANLYEEATALQEGELALQSLEFQLSITEENDDYRLGLLQENRSLTVASLNRQRDALCRTVSKIHQELTEMKYV